MTHREVNILELTLAILIMAGMAFLYSTSGAPFFFPTARDFGVCLPSANLWDIPMLWSVIAQGALILIIAILLIFFNKVYNVTQNPGLAPSIIFLLICAAFPWGLLHLSASALMAFVALISLWILFSAFEKNITSNQLFIVASLLSLASMIQYAFILLLIVFLIVSATLRLLNLRGFLAYLIGASAPYLVALGTGIVAPEQIRIPPLTTFYITGFNVIELLIVNIFLVAIAVFSLLMSSANIVKLRSAKRHIRAWHRAISTLTISLIILMVIDYDNFIVYTMTLFLTTGLECGYSFNTSRTHPVNGWIIVMAVLLIGYGVFATFFHQLPLK